MKIHGYLLSPNMEPDGKVQHKCPLQLREFFFDPRLAPWLILIGGCSLLARIQTTFLGNTPAIGRAPLRSGSTLGPSLRGLGARLNWTSQRLLSEKGSKREAQPFPKSGHALFVALESLDLIPKAPGDLCHGCQEAALKQLMECLPWRRPKDYILCWILAKKWGCKRRT